MSKGSVAKGLAIGVATTLLAGIALELWRENHAEAKKKKQGAQPLLAGADTPGVMERGYWQTVVDSTENTKTNALDDAIKSGLVRLEAMSVFGFAGEKTWVKIYVPKTFKGEAGVALKQWSAWLPSDGKMKPTDAIKFEDRAGENTIVDIYDEAKAKANELGRSVSAAIEGTRNAVLLIGGGALALWVFVAARRR